MTIKPISPSSKAPPPPPSAPDLVYEFADAAGLLNFVHGLSQWVYTQPDADERDRLIALLYAATPQATPGTMIPLYLSLPGESANWPIKPGAVDGAEAVAVLPINLKPISWTNLALSLSLEPSAALPRRDDLVFVVQGVRGDLLAILDAIFELEHEHAEDIQLLLAPVAPASLGGLKIEMDDNGAVPSRSFGWSPDSPDPGQRIACLVKVSGLRRFYLLEKTLTDPHLRLFYRHVFPPYVPVPPGLQLYVEWGYRYTLPPASFLMDAWRRDKLGLVLLPAPHAGMPLVVSSAITFRPVLQVAGNVQIAHADGRTELLPVPAQHDAKLLDVQVRLQKRPQSETRENEQSLRHRIQNDLWRLQRLLARERDAKARRLYIYDDDDPGDMSRLRAFIMENPLVILNEFSYFCGKFYDRVYHLVLLPVEDGTNVVTPDRFPAPPVSERVFRREPAWAAQDEGHELFIPREAELYPVLEPGVENRDELLKRVLGMTPEYDYLMHKIMVLLWPDADGNLVNYHVPLDTAGGFVPMGQVTESMNTPLITPQKVEAVTQQVFSSIEDALKPERVPESVRALRDQVMTTYRSAWEVARQELDQLLTRGAEADRIGQGIRERFAEIEALQSQQFDDWQRFLEQVVKLAEKIEKDATARDAELGKKQAALIDRLRKQVEQDTVGSLRAKVEQVASAMQNLDATQRTELAALLESLAAEMRGSITD